MATAVKISSYIVETFQRFDSDGSGSLDYKELRGALKHYGIDCTHPAAADLITRYDERPDGRMQLHEFAELVINVNEGMIRLGSSHPLPAPTKKKPSLTTPPLDLSPMLDPVTPSAHALKENASGRPLSPIEQAVAQAVMISDRVKSQIANLFSPEVLAVERFRKTSPEPAATPLRQPAFSANPSLDA